MAAARPVANTIDIVIPHQNRMTKRKDWMRIRATDA
jgi:hypothetical protein